jgi:hypothetical protein
MGALFNLANCADAQLLQGLVIQSAAVVLAHAVDSTRFRRQVNLLVNGLLSFTSEGDRHRGSYLQLCLPRASLQL